ncbi:uncharacterized protein [Linepithema humile]|uniref:uncharacterized protein n=1 Tax=Linepithema humile TaxID=83485 RepID=UPI00351EA69F
MDIRIMDLDVSLTPEEVIQVVAEQGDCHKDDVRNGPIRKFKGGLGSMWLQIPALAAIKIAEKGKIGIGWSFARVEVLKKRPLQCFRCLARGHTRNRCPSENADRSFCCYNCGEAGHKAGDCTRKACCPICKGKGLKDNHKVGSPECPLCPPAKGKPKDTTSLVNIPEKEVDMEVEKANTR